MVKSKFSCLVIAQFLLLGCVPEGSEFKPKPSTKFDLYSQEYVVIQHSKKGLYPSSERQFKKFKALNGYYSAFVVNIVEDVAISSNNHSLKEASKQTLDACKLRSRNKNGCIVYASKIPKGYLPKDGTLTLSRGTTKAFKDVINRLYSNNHAAFAINNDSGWGRAIEKTKKSAIETAIEYCGKNQKTTMDKASRTWKKYLKPHHFKCRIVYSD